jgi:(p)ppGpp synthase/HD superfamily hydrolase
MNFDDKIKWCIEQHQNTNHFYDTYLPYEFHLRMVAKVAKDFIKVIEGSSEGDVSEAIDTIFMSCYGHDLIEDTRVSYNDVKEMLGKEVADIIYAVTNEKGKNRRERANKKYYEGISNTPGAVFVKLCDRIANVQYSKMTGSRMFEMYKKENENFMIELGHVGSPTELYHEVFQYLIKLFKD